MIDFYEVLDLKKNCKRNDIKKKYRKLIMIYHPDKGGDSKLFELITLAYETLINEGKRKEFDKAYELWIQSNNDHFSLKNNSMNFLETQNELKEDLDEKELEEIKKNISKENKELVLSKEEMNKRIKELELAREQEDIENIQKKICSSDNFNSLDFNAGFDACVDRKKNSVSIPLQSNDFNYDNNKIIDTNTFNANDLYSSIDNTGLKIKKINKKKIKDKKKKMIQNNLNNFQQDYNKIIEQKLKEREEETNKLSNLKLDQFVKDVPDEYSILDNLEINLNLENSQNTFLLNNQEELKKQFNKLKIIKNNKE